MDSFEFRIQAGWGEGRTSATVMHGRHLPIPATDKRVVVPAFGALPQYSRRRPSTLAAVVDGQSSRTTSSLPLHTARTLCGRQLAKMTRRLIE